MHDVTLTFGVNKSTTTSWHGSGTEIPWGCQRSCQEWLSQKKNPQKLTTESREWLLGAVLSQRMVSELMSRIPVSQTRPS